MIKEVIMPKLGQTMEEGIIEKWRKKEGERVEKGEILLEITTDKATLEVESYASGILKKVIAREGETVPVTEIIAYIGEPEDEIPVISERPKSRAAVVIEETGGREVPGKKEEEAIEAGRIKASPAARRIARENKVDLSLIKGTGPAGRITEKDVLDFKPLSPIRRIIGERMSMSKREIPHYYLTTSLDMKEVMSLRQNFNQKLRGNGLNISYNDFLIKAAGLTIAQYPSFNTYLEAGGIKKREEINIGLAVSIPDGIVVPVIHRVDKASFQEIVKERMELVEKARSFKLTPAEYSGGSFTISNLGGYDIENFCAIINPPECAILAVARIMDRPVVVQGEIAIRPMMKVTLSLDHRLIDGAIGAEFLQKFKELIETPASLCRELL